MTTQTQTKDWELLDQIQRVALDYGVERIESRPLDNQIEITYESIGQGCVLTGLIEHIFNYQYPDRDFSIKMIPSDRKLIVELIGES